MYKRQLEDDFEHHSIDGIVVAPHEDGADDALAIAYDTLLAKAVDAAFALFVAGRDPGEGVMHDGIEGGLQVDAFRQAVGGDEQGAIRFGQFIDAQLAFIGCRLPRDDAGSNPGKATLQLVMQIVRGGDVAAKHYGGKTVAQQLV